MSQRLNRPVPLLQQLPPVPLLQHFLLLLREGHLPLLVPTPGEPLTLVEACAGFSLVVAELAAALLLSLIIPVLGIESGWFCSIIPVLDVLYLAKRLFIETAGEEQHLPDLLRAAHALQMPAPPLAPLLVEEVAEAPFPFHFVT